MNTDWENEIKTVTPLQTDKKISKNIKNKDVSIKFIPKEESKVRRISRLDIEGKDTRQQLEKNTIKKILKGKIMVEKTLDLHGETLGKAKIQVEKFINQNHQNSIRLIKIITGKGPRLSVSHGWKGTGVIKENLPKWLNSIELSTKILWFDYAPKNKGGDGAVLILLKKN